MTGFYAAMAAVTAVHIWRVHRPTEVAHWLAFAIMVAAWPLTYAFIAFGIGARLRDRDRSANADRRAAAGPEGQEPGHRPKTTPNSEAV